MLRNIDCLRGDPHEDVRDSWWLPVEYWRSLLGIRTRYDNPWRVWSNPSNHSSPRTDHLYLSAPPYFMMNRRAFLALSSGVGVTSLTGCMEIFDGDAGIDEMSTPSPTSTPTATPSPTPQPPALGTDLQTDTSSDGFPDLVLEQLDVDPYRKNVFLEVDVIGDVASEPLLTHAQSVLGQAPIENSDGSTGVDLHYVVDADPLPPALEGELDSSLPLELLRYGHHEVRSFERPHRGYRHAIITGTDVVDGWEARRFVIAVDTEYEAQLTNALVAQLSGRFNPYVSDDIEPLQLQTDRSPEWFIDNVDWVLLGDNLSESIPSIWYLREQFAHLADDSDVELIEQSPADPAPGQDTAGDGISDRLIMESDLFDGADVLRRNIFFEVHHTPAVDFDEVRVQLDRLERFFADAPVRNPDGSMGIDVHYVIEGGFDLFDEPITERDLASIYWNHFDRKDKGYYYLLFVDELEGLRGRAVEEVLGMELHSTTFLHEVGHGLGLSAGFVGIDDFQRTFAEYPSVMNYNAPSGAFCFAGDTVEEPVRIDWQIIADDMADNAPSTHGIER